MPPADWPAAFLGALAATANVSEAAKRAGVDRTTPYARRAEDPAFAAGWRQALQMGIDALELEARRRALEGTERPVFYQGAECGRVREFSDTLMIFLLKAHRPRKYRENVRHELSGKGGGPIDVRRLPGLADDDLDALESLLSRAVEDRPASPADLGPAGAGPAV